MSTGFKIFGVFFTLTCLFACNKLEEVTQPIEIEEAGTLDAEFMGATASTATFECDLTVNPDAGKSFKAGIMYSTSKRFTTSSAKRAVIANPVEGHHQVTIEGLIFCTDYYYCTYVYRLGEYKLSEVKPFSTNNVSVDIDAVDVQFNEVTIAGQVHMEAGLEGKIRAGFMFSDAEDFSSERSLDSALELDEEGRFEVRVTGLDQGTTYYYTYYIVQGSTKVKAPVKAFFTMSPYMEAFGELDFSAAKDLSASEPANCYIITEPGVYKFKAVKGNSDVSIGEVKMVNVLWETFGGMMAPEACQLIDATSYMDGYAAVRVPSDFKEGNAVVVAKNEIGEVIWSWHFWLTSELPKEHVYANNAGILMDRNLGALSMEKGNPKGFGLLYQWGRKDPFPGSATLTGTAMAKTTAKVYATISSAEEGTIEYSIKNPSTMIFTDGASTDWLYNGGTAGIDNTRWQSEKTMYDPCPPGWRVPDGGPASSVQQNDGSAKYEGGVWYRTGIPTGGGFPYPAEDYAKAGITIPAQYSGEDAWYPAAGSISAVDGTFVEVGRDGMYWSVTPCGRSDVYGFNFYYYKDNKGYVYHSPMFTRATAASVRCCKIQ